MTEVKRWTAKRKQEVVLRLLQGESLDQLSRETGQTAAALSEWRETFLQTGLEGLKRRSKDPQVEALQKEKEQLQSKVGELLMDKELLEHRLARTEGEVPFPARKSERRAGPGRFPRSVLMVGPGCAASGRSPGRPPTCGSRRPGRRRPVLRGGRDAGGRRRFRTPT